MSVFHRVGYVSQNQTVFISALNEDLKSEFQSIVQYAQHVAMVKGAEYLSLIDELRVHLAQELTHAQVLSEQIAFLGGIPTTTVRQVPEWKDSHSA